MLSKVLGRRVTFHPLTFEEQKQARAGGAIVNFSSPVTKLAPPAYAACAATKGAVEAMTLIVARELRGRDFLAWAFGGDRRGEPGGSGLAAAPPPRPQEE